MIARALILAGLAAAVSAAELNSAAVQLEAAPEVPVVIPEELPPDTSIGARTARIDRFALEGPRFLKDVTRTPLATLRTLAPLQGEQVKKAANLHDPLKLDEFRTLTFDGLEIYGFIGDQQELWPIRITVSTVVWEIADDLKIGSDAAKVKEILGEPNVSQPEVWLYQGNFQNVNFYFRQNKIDKIEFIYYLD